MKELVVVDDNPDQIDLMLLALGVMGLPQPVVAFDSGPACVGALERGAVRPGLIVLDVNLPGLDGPATVERIRRLRGMAGVPIVMLSTSDLPIDIARSRHAGADSYMLKPQRDRRWSDVVNDLMRHWSDAT